MSTPPKQAEIITPPKLGGGRTTRVGAPSAAPAKPTESHPARLNAQAKAQVIRPPKHIRQKVGSTGGIELEEALTRADLAVVHYSGTFLREIEPELEKLRKAYEGAAKDPRNIGRYQPAMYNAAHEVRGQSGTFGYPLATLVADTVCKFLDPEREWEPDDLELLGLHVLAIRAVFKQSLKQDGGALGQELKELLTSLRARRLKVDD